MVISRDGVSPHQIPHTEIIEPFVVREVGNSLLQDTLRGGIGSLPVITRPSSLAGSTSPGVRIRGRVMLSSKKGTIILKDMGIVTSIVLVGRHKMVGE